MQILLLRGFPFFTFHFFNQTLSFLRKTCVGCAADTFFYFFRSESALDSPSEDFFILLSSGESREARGKMRAITLGGREHMDGWLGCVVE